MTSARRLANVGLGVVDALDLTPRVRKRLREELTLPLHGGRSCDTPPSEAMVLRCRRLASRARAQVVALHTIEEPEQAARVGTALDAFLAALARVETLHDALDAGGHCPTCGTPYDNPFGQCEHSCPACGEHYPTTPGDPSCGCANPGL